VIIKPDSASNIHLPSIYILLFLFAATDPTVDFLEQVYPGCVQAEVFVCAFDLGELLHGIDVQK
jgi:hypothetical protein